MKRSWAISSMFLAASIFSPAWGSVPPQPGTVNYIEGQTSIDGRALNERSVGSLRLAAGQSLSTLEGRAEILLTPGVFFRVREHSSIQMTSPGLADTQVALRTGRAMVEVAEIHPANNIRVTENGASIQLVKAGLYDFDAARSLLRVFDGEALVQVGGKQIEVKSGHELSLAPAGKGKTQKFDKNAVARSDDFYRWSSLRSSYLAEANVDAGRTYAGGVGWSPSLWYGDGWYWNPGFGAYTFIPGDGIFYDPFGWGFYSPWLAFGAPYWGFGYGYGVGYYHHFGPGYHPATAANTHVAAGNIGHAYHVTGGAVSGFARGGAFARGGGFARAGGFAGGGFHGGGGRGR
jgi:hypothetical protein